MKKSLLSLGLATLAILFSSSYAFGEEIKPSEISNSDCKNDDLPETRSSYFDTLPSWEVSYKDGKLTIITYDFLANCCPERFDSQIDFQDNKISFKNWSVEGFGACACMCLFDLASTFDGVAPGEYELELYHYFNYIPVHVNLQEGFNETFRIKESAVESINASDGSLSFANGVVKAVSSGKFRLDIFGANGVKEYSLEGVGEAELSLGSLSHGVHFVRLTHADGKIETLRISR